MCCGHLCYTVWFSKNKTLPSLEDHTWSQVLRLTNFNSHGRLTSTNNGIILICVSVMPTHTPNTNISHLILTFCSPWGPTNLSLSQCDQDCLVHSTSPGWTVRCIHCIVPFSESVGCKITYTNIEEYHGLHRVCISCPWIVHVKGIYRGPLLRYYTCLGGIYRGWVFDFTTQAILPFLPYYYYAQHTYLHFLKGNFIHLTKPDGNLIHKTKSDTFDKANFRRSLIL